MFSTQLNTLVILAAGLSVSAAPASVRRSDTSPALAAREPQFNAILPNQLPVAGVLPFDITVTPGAQNTTAGLPFGFPFKFMRGLEARQLNATLPNQLPVEGVPPFDISVTPGARNTTVGIPSGFPSRRGLETRQLNATLPNQLPVAGVLPFDISVTPGAQNTTVGLPSNFPFKLKRQDDSSADDSIDDSEDGVFNFTRGSHFPFFFPIGRLPNNDNNTDNANSNDTVGWFWGDEGDSAEKRQFNFTLPNRLPVEGGLPFGLDVTGDGGEGSTVGVPSGFPF